MNDRIKSKRVGRVNILEICGDFRSQFARRGKAAFAQISQGPETDLLINLHELQSIDEFGTAVLAESPAHYRKCCLLWQNHAVQGAFDRSKLESKFHFVRSTQEAAEYFSSEFAEVQPGSVDGEERRGFMRLPTVLPVQFARHGGDPAEVFFSVVTNLSEGGLYAEFIDSDTETAAVKKLDPLELNLLDLRISLTPGTVIKAGAKVLHVKKGTGGIGMEFYQFQAGDKEKLIEWLARQLEGNKVLSRASAGPKAQIQGGVHS